MGGAGARCDASSIAQIDFGHSPFMLDGRRNLRDPFRFENTWLKATKFEYRVNEWWNRYDVTGIPSFRLEKKLKIPAYLYK